MLHVVNRAQLDLYDLLIRGDTTHYEHIAAEVTRGIGQSAQETGVPHTYGVLTCETLEQAIDREPRYGPALALAAAYPG